MDYAQWVCLLKSDIMFRSFFVVSKHIVFTFELVLVFNAFGVTLVWFELGLTSHQHIKVIRRRGPRFKVSSD